MKERQQIVEEEHNWDWIDQVEGYMPCFRKDQKGDSEVVVDYFEDFYYFYGNRFHNLVFCFILCIRFDNIFIFSIDIPSMKYLWKFVCLCFLFARSKRFKDGRKTLAWLSRSDPTLLL